MQGFLHVFTLAVGKGPIRRPGPNALWDYADGPVGGQAVHGSPAAEATT